MVVYEIDGGEKEGTTFIMELYKWQVLYNHNADQYFYAVEFDKTPMERTFKKFWYEIKTKLTWNFMSVLMNNDRIAIFTLDELR